MKIIKRIIVLLMAVAIVSGCVAPADDTYAKMKKYKLYVGQSKKFSITNTKKVKWKSYNKWVATISKKGVVKARHAGKAKMRAKFGRQKLFFKIVVKNNKSGRAASNSYVPANPSVPTTPTVSIEDQIASQINVSFSKLQSGGMLFTVKNNSPYFVQQAKIKITYCDFANRDIKTDTIHVLYLKANGEGYSVEEYVNGAESIIVNSIDIEYNEQCYDRSAYVDMALKYDYKYSQYFAESEITNRTADELYYTYVVLYQDSAGNIIDADGGYSFFQPYGYSIKPYCTDDCFRGSPYSEFTGKYMPYSYATIIWSAALRP